jgi:hypothetical protein
MDGDFIVQADRAIKAERSRCKVACEGTQESNAATSLLREAIQTIEQRRANYGPPTEHFRRTVGMLNALFAHKLKEPFTEQDWPQIMLCDKMARHQERPIADNPLDAAGYAACWAEAMAAVS